MQLWEFHNNVAQRWKITLASNGARQDAEEFSAEAPSLQLSPNPASDQVTVVQQASEAAEATLTLMDSLGRVVQQHQKALQAGENQWRLSVRGLSGGLYMVQVMVKGQSSHPLKAKMLVVK